MNIKNNIKKSLEKDSPCPICYEKVFKDSTKSILYLNCPLETGIGHGHSYHAKCGIKMMTREGIGKDYKCCECRGTPIIRLCG